MRHNLNEAESVTSKEIKDGSVKKVQSITISNSKKEGKYNNHLYTIERTIYDETKDEAPDSNATSGRNSSERVIEVPLPQVIKPGEYEVELHLVMEDNLGEDILSSNEGGMLSSDDMQLERIEDGKTTDELSQTRHLTSGDTY